MSVAASAGVNFSEKLSSLPAMTDDELSQLKLWLDERIAYTRTQMEAEELSTDGSCKKTDWWNRAKAFKQKAAHLSQAIQEERGRRRRSRTNASNPDRKFLEYLKRAMKAILSPELTDKIMATAIEFQRLDEAPVNELAKNENDDLP